MNVRPQFLARLFAVTVLSYPISICPAQTAGESVTIVSHVDIIPDAYKPLSEENAARLLRSQKTATQHDAGLISYVVLQQLGAKITLRSSRRGVIPGATRCIKVPIKR